MNSIPYIFIIRVHHSNSKCISNDFVPSILVFRAIFLYSLYSLIQFDFILRVYHFKESFSNLIMSKEI